MSYMALYRKFRPDVFEEVKGQDAIVTTLRNQVRTGRTGHAYLFCGTRGTGKTTLAKIFAKAINCESPVDGDPCGKCPACRAIAEGRSMNVIEIDAASNNGVDNIRQIREEVSYRPTEGHYKVYIIDEVHMLSTSAFNALLKTLEEPPEYVVFILATTESRSILPTITSRCQRYDFKRMTGEVMVSRMRELMDREGAEGEDAALAYIARKADGSMRDAISLLDQCLNYYPDEKLTYEHVLEMIGTVDTEVFEKMLQAIVDYDSAGTLRLLEQALMEGREAPQLAVDFIWYLRNAMLCRNLDDPAGMVDLPQAQIDALREMLRDVDEQRIISMISTMSEAQARMRFTAQKRVLLEMTLIKLCTPSMSIGGGEGLERIKVLEAAVEQQDKTMKKAAAKMAAMIASQTNPGSLAGAAAAGTAGVAGEQAPKKKSLPKALPEQVKKALDMMQEIRRSADASMRPYLREERFAASVNERGELVFVTQNPVYYDWLKAESHTRALSDLINKKVGADVPLSIEYLGQEYDIDDEYANEEDLKQINIEITMEEE
ncbi:MAG: DNA polymerase III subunit gamma/tau [Lachnospiraceae bacterium]|nr:DNA polymerase III subunit gamma/tau [Lachnospiraceae bacterium]